MNLTKKFLIIFGCLIIIVFLWTITAYKNINAQTITPGATASCIGGVSSLIACPFGGRIAFIEPCYNGIMFGFTPEKESSSPAKPGTLPNSFLFEYKNWIPMPEIGKGMYRWWAPSIGNVVLGDAYPGGECISIPNSTPIPTLWNVQKMGTTQIPGP